MLVKLKKYLFLTILVMLPISVHAFDNFDCVGSEPFWKLSLTAHRFTFKESNKKEVIMPSAQPTSAEDMKIEHIRVYRTKMNGTNLIVIIQNQSCTDGKSADVFQFEGLVITNDKVFHGCCSKKLVLTG